MRELAEMEERKRQEEKRLADAKLAEEQKARLLQRQQDIAATHNECSTILAQMRSMLTQKWVTGTAEQYDALAQQHARAVQRLRALAS